MSDLGQISPLNSGHSTSIAYSRPITFLYHFAPRNWAMSYRRELKISLTFALVVGIAMFFKPDHYRSEARILPSDSKSSSILGQYAAAAVALGLSQGGSESSDGAYIDILESRTIGEAILRRQYEFKKHVGLFGRARFYRTTLEEYLRADNLDEGIKKLKPRLKFTRDLKSRLLVISAETDSPELSQQIVSHLVQQLETFVGDKGRVRGHAKAAFAAERIAEAKRELAGSETSMRELLEHNRNYYTSSDPTLRLQAARLEAELKLRQQILFSLTLTWEQALMDEKNEIPILTILDQPNLPVEASGPGCGPIIAITFLLSLVGSLLWRHRQWLSDMLGEDEELVGASRHPEKGEFK